MFKLTEECLNENLNYFLCDYGNDNYKKILSKPNFLPESFTVYEKMCGKELIYFTEISFEDWCTGLVLDQIGKLTWVQDRDSLKDKTIENVLFLLRYNINGKILAENIYNQEFVDIIRRVIYFTIFGKCDSDVYTAKEFNELAYLVMPYLLNIIEEKDYSLQKIFKLSIASGLMGLDMKGAPAAASNYANSGIPMKPYLNISIEDVISQLLKELEIVVQNADTPIFYWDEFIKRLQEAESVVWMTDDYIESFFDLYFLQKLIVQFPNLNIDIIPKNGHFGNDMSWEDLEDIVQFPCFKAIKEKMKSGQITINHFGPQMGAANLSKLSAQCVDSIFRADFIVTKGCRIHEMIQGGIDKEMFSAYIVTRELSEIITGFDSKRTPILFLHSQPGEYLFWGISYDNAKRRHIENGREVFTSCCTIKEHEIRKKMKPIEEIACDFNCIYSHLLNYKSNLTPVYQELVMLKKQIETYTINNYLSNCQKYVNIHTKLNEFDQSTWDFFVSAVSKYFDKDFSNINILDVGAGPGRDLLFGQHLGFKMVGCDKCEEFVNQYNQVQINAPSYVYGDACQLPFEKEIFDVVRQSASLVHIPIIGKGYGTDLAIHESYRVLKTGGLLYVLVKEGGGINVIDTNEGLGKRVFQFYEDKDIRQIFSRNNFKILSIKEIEEMRQGVLIKWLACIAVKEG